MNNIEEVKSRIDIVDFIGESVKLRRSGKNYSGFCPFHDNTRSPAFAVFPDSGTWRCFGQCNEGGDVFKFVMKKEGWEFGETLRFLADRTGVQLRQLSPAEEAQVEENERLRELLENAVTFFRHQLIQTEAGRPARDYLAGRSLEDDAIEVWGFGYAPNSWDSALKHFESNGFSRDDIIAAGLVSQNDAGRVYDRFRDRVMIPIRDGRGRMTGFGARTLDPEGVPKYLNTPQTEVFDKGGLLFGLDQARKGIREKDQVVIVEGYLDVIALHNHGFSNAVSPMGTALTEPQLRLLKRRTANIVLALDADAAGNRATMRGLELARKTFDREQELAFDARGLLGHEARLKADIRVTMLPAGQDPDDVVNRNPEEWAQIMAAARPIVTHVMETLAIGRDLNDPKTKREIADQVLPLIHDLGDPIERDTYVQKLARLLKIDERSLGTGAPARRRPGRRPVRPTISKPANLTSEGSLPDRGGGNINIEVYTLGVLLRRPDLLYRADRALQGSGLPRLNSQDFSDSSHQAIMRLVQESLAQDFSEPLQVVLGSLPLTLMEKADTLLAQTEKLDLYDERVLPDLLRSIIDLRRRHVSQNIHHLRFLMEDAQEKGDLIVNQYQSTMVQHITTLGKLDTAWGRCNDRSLFIG
jgi:DNA primase